MAIVEGSLKMFEEVRGWMETPVESDDLLGLGKIPYSVVQLGLCLGIEYKDIYEIDHNYREHYEKTLHLLQLWRHRGGQREATWWRLVCCLERLQDTQILEDVKRYLTEKEERTKCRVTGMDVFVKYTSELYQMDRQSKQDSGIIMDLSISPQNSVSDSVFDPTNEFPVSCDVSFDPPSGCSSPQGLSSDKTSFFSFSSSSNLTSLGVSSDHSDNIGSHLQQQQPLSGSYPDHCCTKKECFFTPSSSIDIPEHSDVSDTVTSRRDRYDGWAVKEYHQRELRLKSEEFQKLKELYHKEKERVHALKQKLVHAQSCAFYEKIKKERMQSKVADCEQQLDYLMNHLRICDEKYLEMHREREELRTQINKMRVYESVNRSVQAKLALLEEEKKGLLEWVEELGAKYLKAESDVCSLRRECLCVTEEKEREMESRQQYQHESQCLQNIVQEIRTELQSCKRLLEYHFTSTHPARVEQGTSDCHHPASKRKKTARRLCHRRHFSDSYLECGDDVSSLSDICPTSPC